MMDEISYLLDSDSGQNDELGHSSPATLDPDSLYCALGSPMVRRALSGELPPLRGAGAFGRASKVAIARRSDGTPACSKAHAGHRGWRSSKHSLGCFAGVI